MPTGWCPRCTLRIAKPGGIGRLGGILSVIYTPQNEVSRKGRMTLLPLLVILFIFSYTILTMLVVEQGRTIENQRGLLREMLRDSSQLATLKSRIAQQDAERAHSKSAAQAKKDDGNSAHAADAVTPPQTPGNDPKRPGKSARNMKEVPQKPAADLQDVRRSTDVI